MAPTDPVEPFCQELATNGEDVILVGHLPFLGRLASRLVTGAEDQPVVSFRNSGVVCLTEDAGQWTMLWALTPEVLL